MTAIVKIDQPTLSCILFDLDGTLVDSRETIGAALLHALERVGVLDPDSVPVETVIGRPLLDIFCAEFAMDIPQAEQAICHYREHYDSLEQAGTKLYPDIREVLSLLRDAGLRMFVATVKPTTIAEKVLADMQLSSFFDGVAGASMSPERRDKASIISHALRKFGLEAGCSLMIGDRDEDIEGARKNGVAALGVAYGYGSREELSAAGPLRIVERAGEIPGLLLDGSLIPFSGSPEQHT